MVLELTAPEIRRTDYRSHAGFEGLVINRLVQEDRRGRERLATVTKPPTRHQEARRNKHDRGPLLASLHRNINDIKTKYPGKCRKDPNYQAEVAPILARIKELESAQRQDLNVLKNYKKGGKK